MFKVMNIVGKTTRMAGKTVLLRKTSASETSAVCAIVVFPPKLTSPFLVTFI